MDQFIDFILTEMTADQFATLLHATDIPIEEQQRLAKLAYDREREMIYLHVMYPNWY